MKKFSCLKSSLIALILLAASCEGKLVPDPVDPRLPIYSEKGYDAAGAFIDGHIWKSVFVSGWMIYRDNPQIISYDNSDSLIISLEGSSTRFNYIVFNLSQVKVTQFDDLLKLDNRLIRLDGSENYATCYKYRDYGSTEDEEGKGIGQIYFRHVAVMDSVHIIVSGTFGFSFIDSEGKTIKVTSGRFDYDLYKNRDFEIVNPPE